MCHFFVKLWAWWMGMNCEFVPSSVKLSNRVFVCPHLAKRQKELPGTNYFHSTYMYSSILDLGNIFWSKKSGYPHLTRLIWSTIDTRTGPGYQVSFSKSSLINYTHTCIHVIHVIHVSYMWHMAHITTHHTMLFSV